MSDLLPPKDSNNSSKERHFRTALKPSDYILLEQEASERGLTPYKLTAKVMALYVKGDLVPKPQETEQ